MKRHALDDERFADWVDGRLDDVQRDRFEAELRVNSELRTAAEAYRRTVFAVRASLRDGDGMGPAFADQLMARLAAESRARRFRLVPLLGSAAAAVLLAGLWFVVREFDGSTPESSEVAALRESDRDAKTTRKEIDRFYSDDLDDPSSSDSTAMAPGRAGEPPPLEVRRPEENRAAFARESLEPKDEGGSVDDLLAFGAKAGEPVTTTSAARRLRAEDDESVRARTRAGDENIAPFRQPAERAKSADRFAGRVSALDSARDALRAADDPATLDARLDPVFSFDFGSLASSVEAPLVLLVELPADVALLGDPAPPESGGVGFSIGLQRDGSTQGVVAGGGSEQILLAEERARDVALQFFAVPIEQLQALSSNTLPPRLASMLVQELVPPQLQLGSPLQPVSDPEVTEKENKRVAPSTAAKVAVPADKRTESGAYRPLPGDQAFRLEGDPAQVFEYLRALAPQVRKQSGTLAVQRAFDLVAVDEPAPLESTTAAEDETRDGAEAGRRGIANQEELGRSEGVAAGRSDEESPPEQLRKQRAAAQTWIVLRRVPRPAPPAGPSSPGPLSPGPVVPTKRRDDR